MISICITFPTKHFVSSSLPGLFSFVFGLVGMMVYDWNLVRQSGMFQGYNGLTCTVVALQVGKIIPFFVGCILWSGWLLTSILLINTEFSARRLWAGWS